MQKSEIVLRSTSDRDLDCIFEQQRDRVARRMAAFTSANPDDRQAFEAHWAKVRADDGVVLRTIVLRGQVAGYILSHSWFADPEISYWIGREYWGQGVATLALRRFLAINAVRPLFARTAADNLASQRVLQKCGFQLSGHDRGFANARAATIDENIYRLDA